MKNNGRHSKDAKATRKFLHDSRLAFRRLKKQTRSKQHRSPDTHKNSTLPF